jgi:hypothetical protein
MTHSWQVLATDRNGVMKYSCKVCHMLKTVYPSSTLPYPKILWSPRGKKPYYGKTPACVTEQS